MHFVNFMAIVSIILQSGVGWCYVINGEYIGVIYNVNTRSTYYNETLEDIKLQIGLISNRFKNVFTFGVMTSEVNSTYYTSTPQVHFAEAAGLVNKENLRTTRSKGEKKNLKPFIGIFPHNDENRFVTEIQLAIESAERAEYHSSHTVQGFVVDFERRPVNISILHMIRKMVNTSDTLRKLNLAFGVKLNCTDISIKESSSSNETYLQIIISESSFIICVEYPEPALNGKKAFDFVAEKFKKIRSFVQTSDSQIKVIGQTGLPARSNLKQDVDSLWAFWFAADSWATDEKFHLVINEAFDNPWSEWNDSLVHEGSCGWWDVKKDLESGKFNIFTEKVAVKSHADKTNHLNIILLPWVSVPALICHFV